MKKIIISLIVVIFIAAIGGYVYWQNNKNKIIKDGLQTAVKSKTDSLYKVHYDSSQIDEITGNAVFYNVSMHADSMQTAILKSEDSLPNILLDIKVKELGALGVNVPGLLTQQTVSAKIVYLKEPMIQLIQTGSGKEKTFTSADTMALYQQILGKFKSIKADTIRIIDGNVLITDKDGKILTSLEKINVNLTNFLIDSTHDYSNIASYFIKDVKLTVATVKFLTAEKNTQVALTNVEYDAAKRTIIVEQAKQYNVTSNDASIDIKKITIDSLNTDAFINAHQLKAGNITCDGGLITINIKGKPAAKKGDPTIELSGDFFDEAQVDFVNLNNTKVVIVNQAKPNDKPIELNNVKFTILKKVNLYDGNTLSSLINNAEWRLSSDGFSMSTPKGIYKVNIGNFILTNAATASITVSHVQLKPLLTEAAYGKKIGKQADLYNFDFNNITLDGVDIHTLISESKIEAEEMSVQPIIRIFNDRTLPADTGSRLGTYPQEGLLNLSIPVAIKKLHIINGSVSYREKSSMSALVGNVFFTNINATVSNFTNLPEKIAANPMMILDAKALFLNKAHFATQWTFPLNKKDGSFTITGHLDTMDGKILNPIIEPLAMKSITHGIIDKMLFTVKGDDYGTKTTESLFYHNMDFTLLKQSKNDTTLKKNGFQTFVANILILNENTPDKERKEIDLPFQRDIHNPFFYVVWTSIFTAAKKIGLGKAPKQ